MIEERDVITSMLNADLPRSAVSTRSQAGVELSYVQGWWVIDRLNTILGVGRWQYDASDTREVSREVDDKGRCRVSYSARCRLSVTIAGCTVTIADVGHGHGTDRSVGHAVESAEKEAATDALKRCAKSLGRHLGLALYDRTQEHVVDDALDVTRMSIDELRAAYSSANANEKLAIKAEVEKRKKGGV